MRMTSMKVVDFAEMLRDSIEEKINECRGEIHESHNPVYNNSILINIQTLEWVLGQIQNLVINRVAKDWPIHKYISSKKLFVYYHLSLVDHQ
jgi:hypothetical protein